MTQLTDETKLRLLLEISSQIRSKVEKSLSLDATLELILQTVGRLVPYDRAMIRLSDREQMLDRQLVLTGPDGAGPDDALASLLEAPILFRDRTIGSLLVGFRQAGKYAAVDTEILNFFAREVSFTIEKALLHEALLTQRKMESELEVARQVQLSLLPAHAPRLEGFDVAAVSFPAAGVGGDYYDFIPFPENNIGLVVADVVGKGMSAALIMASFRAFLRAQIRNDYAIATIFRKINNLLKEGLDDNRFVTAVYGVLDVTHRVLTYCNAGHHPPLVVHPDGGVSQLSRGGVVMGIFQGSDYKESRKQLRPGDILILYTDGLVEAFNESEQQYGVERLLRTVQANRPATAEQICSAILTDVESHCHETALQDDLTLVVVKANN